MVFAQMTFSISCNAFPFHICVSRCFVRYVRGYLNTFLTRFSELRNIVAVFFIIRKLHTIDLHFNGLWVRDGAENTNQMAYELHDKYKWKQESRFRQIVFFSFGPIKARFSIFHFWDLHVCLSSDMNMVGSQSERAFLFLKRCTCVFVLWYEHGMQPIRARVRIFEKMYMCVCPLIWTWYAANQSARSYFWKDVHVCLSSDMNMVCSQSERAFVFLKRCTCVFVLWYEHGMQPIRARVLIFEKMYMCVCPLIWTWYAANQSARSYFWKDVHVCLSSDMNMVCSQSERAFVFLKRCACVFVLWYEHGRQPIRARVRIFEKMYMCVCPLIWTWYAANQSARFHVSFLRCVSVLWYEHGRQPIRVRVVYQIL